MRHPPSGPGVWSTVALTLANRAKRNLEACHPQGWEGAELTGPRNSIDFDDTERTGVPANRHVASTRAPRQPCAAREGSAGIGVLSERMTSATDELRFREVQRVRNVEIVRQAIDACGRRDVEALRRLMRTDVELDWSASKGWFAGVYCGIDEVIRVFADYFSAFEAIAIEPESFVAGGDSVAVPNVARLYGREGIAVSARATFVYTLRHGAVARICLYQELADAVEAVGIAA